MNFKYLANAYFTPLDMTDYEENFVGWNEVGGMLPFNETNWIAHMQEPDVRVRDRKKGKWKEFVPSDFWIDQEANEFLDEINSPFAEQPEIEDFFGKESSSAGDGEGEDDDDEEEDEDEDGGDEEEEEPELYEFEEIDQMQQEYLTKM